MLGRCFGSRLMPRSSGGPGHGSSRRSLGCSSPCVAGPGVGAWGTGGQGPRRGGGGGAALVEGVLCAALSALRWRVRCSKCRSMLSTFLSNSFPPSPAILHDLIQLQDLHLVANLRLQLLAGRWRRFKQPRPPWALHALHCMHCEEGEGREGMAGGRWGAKALPVGRLPMPQQAAAWTEPAGACSQCRSHTRFDLRSGGSGRCAGASRRRRNRCAPLQQRPPAWGAAP